MILKIKNQIEQHIEQMITPIDYYVLLEKIRFEITEILNYHKKNMNIYNFTVICDKQNNINKNEIFLEVYIKEKKGLDIKMLTFFVDNKNSIIKRIRKKKLNKINESEK